ncbi:efflux RND transporter permease subunit [Marinicella meishanensis]|uniref:efflux RND transporter permease subunit n=1 Tax=Marinicella meishanensis TaxID=2873263 RepID=UPI001CBEC4C1|nr:efflux RND transporter permease subunit [Marinicella sp. NBU2979]
MNLAQLAIEKNRITLLVLFSIIMMGMAIYSTLSRDSMPPYTVRVASVVSSFPGASPERVEQLVTDKIEQVAQELPELKEVSSTSRTGLSVVSVSLKDEVNAKDLQAVWDRLRRKLENIEGLPEGVDPDLNDDGVGDVYGIVVGLTSDGFSYAQMKEYADDIRDDLIKIPEAAKVELGGLQEERVFVEFNNAKLNEYGLTANMLKNFIAATNIVSSGGQINLGDERVILEPTGNFNDVADIRDLLIPVGEGGTQLIQLGDIAQVSQSYIDPPVQIVSFNGQRAVTLHVNLKANANVIDLGVQVDATIRHWQTQLPIGLELSRVSSMDHYIDVKIDDFVVNLIQAISIVLLVMLLFLGIRTGLIIASLIPIVTIMTLMLMGVMNIGLNQVTLAALIMALGMLVDNAIVVAETIMVKIENGKQAKSAAVEACSELFLPLLISTLTTSAAFLAFYMSPTTMGDIVGPIFVVISIALLSSWIIALTVITLFCYLFLKIDANQPQVSWVDRIILRLKGLYKSVILVALNHKVTVVVVVFVLFIGALNGFRYIQFLFFPDSDRNMITVDVNLAAGTKIESTAAIVNAIEAYIADELLVTESRTTGIVDWSSYIGKGPESYDLGYAQEEADSSYAHILINTSTFEVNNVMIAALDDFSFDAFPDAEVKVGVLAGGGGGLPIEIKVSGDDPDQLAIIAESIKLQLSKIAGTKNVKDDWGPKSKKFLIDIDQNRAQAAGVTSQDIATSLKTVLDGFKTGEYREDNKTIPIIMRSDVNQQQSLASLETLNVYAQSSGRSVPLLQVAQIIPQWQYSKIKRLDLERTINITSKLTASGNASAITAEITPWLEQQQNDVWSEGYVFKLGGDAEQTAESMGSVISYLPLSGFIIVLLLMIQFNSFRHVGMVLLTIPLGIIGVTVGLLIFQEPFGFMPFLGVISLAGIVINNAIVLLDRIGIEQKEAGRTVNDAIVVACLQRFRPILLATFTTVLGLIPLYLSGGEMWEGMAVSIMVGLLFGTLITLIFIPVLYSLMYRLSFAGYVFNEQLLTDND